MMQDYDQELVAIRELLKNNLGGMSVTDISKALKKNKNTIGRYLDILLVSGQVEMRAFGMAKVYTLSQRVPLSAMLSYSKELILVLDEESRIVDINDNFSKLLQVSRVEALGKNIAYLQPPGADVHELLDAITRNGTGEETVTFHVRDAEDRIFHQQRVPTVFDDGRKGITLILEDVTTRILAEREIRNSEERFRMMADNIRDGLMIIQDGKTIYANNRIAEITGYSFTELESMEPFSIFAPDDLERAREQIRILEAEPDKPSTLQAWIIRKDRKRRYITFRVSGVHHQGSILNFVIFTDITRSKEQEARLAESEQRFRMMADNIQDGLVIIENYHIVFSNRRIKEITGYTMEELAAMGPQGIFLSERSQDIVDLPVQQAITPEEINRIFRSVKPESDTPAEFKIWIRRKEGTKRYLQGKITAATHGNVTSYYLTLADITDFAERERNLRERIASLQDLLR